MCARMPRSFAAKATAAAWFLLQRNHPTIMILFCSIDVYKNCRKNVLCVTTPFDACSSSSANIEFEAPRIVKAQHPPTQTISTVPNTEHGEGEGERGRRLQENVEHSGSGRMRPASLEPRPAWPTQKTRPTLDLCAPQAVRPRGVCHFSETKTDAKE
jgi:hypothetical protein